MYHPWGPTWHLRACRSGNAAEAWRVKHVVSGRPRGQYITWMADLLGGCQLGFSRHPAAEGRTCDHGERWLRRGALQGRHEARECVENDCESGAPAGGPSQNEERKCSEMLASSALCCLCTPIDPPRRRPPSPPFSSPVLSPADWSPGLPTPPPAHTGTDTATCYSHQLMEIDVISRLKLNRRSRTLKGFSPPSPPSPPPG